MYTITHNGKTLYDPRLPGFPVERPKLAREANVFDTLTFTLYPGNPEYEQLDRKSSILNLYQDIALVAQFIPVYQRTVFNGGIEYKCKNILCRMEDFYYRYLEFTGTASEFIDDVLAAYNARVDNAYKITKGNIHSASVDYKTPDPKTCFSALKAITDANGGYLAPRFENGTIYLDYLQDADLPVCEQKIMFGDNMTDLFIEKDTDNCYSVLYPFGTNSDNEVVSIAAVNGGVDYLENASAVALYGRREKKLTWDNVETPAELLSYAQAKLSEIAAQYYEAVSLSAVDLHHLDVNIPALSFLSMVDCVSAPHGYSHRYPATKMEIPLDEPKSENITLGTAPLSMTDRITLERQKNEAARSSYGRAISKANKDIESHWVHVTEVTDQGMEDCFGVIGVKLDAQHKPIKDAQGNYVWAGPNDSPAEIWGHLHRNAWSTQIMNNIKDANGNIISLAEVYTDAYGNAIINAINDQRTGTATINANRIKLNATDTITLDALMGIEANTSQLRVIGDLYVDNVIWTTDISALSSIHSDITIDAPTIEGGYGRFANLYCKSEEDQYGELTGGVDVSTAYNAFQFIVDPNNSGHFILQGKTLSDQTNWANAANFNIAATQYYNDGVAAARSSVYAKKGTWASGAVAINPYYMNGSTETPAGGSGAVVNLIASVPMVSDVPQWTNGSIIVTVKDGTAPTGLTHTVSIPSSSAIWSAQKVSDTLYAVTCNVGGAAINKPGGLDTTDSYNAGSYAVTLNNPDWGTAPSPLIANRTVSVSTSGRVDSNGTAANLTKAIALYLTQGSFDSAHKMTVNLRDTSSSGTVRAETEVDASGVYSDGQDSVNVVMGNWSNGSVTFSPSVGAGNSKTLVLSEISGSNSITSNGTYTYKVMYEDVYGNDQETGLTKSVSVNVSGGGSIVVNDIQLNASSYAQGKDQGGQMVIELGNNSDGTYPVEIFTNTSFQLNKWYGFRITVGNVYKNYYFKTN